MKALFAIGREEITKAVVDRYNKEIGNDLNYKNVYYFNAIVKELEREKDYDVIVIDEVLETITIDENDKMLLQSLQMVSERAVKIDKTRIPIILISKGTREKGENFLKEIYKFGIFNALIKEDRKISKICEYMQNPKSKEEAASYYEIEVNETEVHELEIIPIDQLEKILDYFKKISNTPENFGPAFEKMANQYTEFEVLYIMDKLTQKVFDTLLQTNARFQNLVANRESILAKGNTREEEHLQNVENVPSMQNIQDDNISINTNTNINEGLNQELNQNVFIPVETFNYQEEFNEENKNSDEELNAFGMPKNIIQEVEEVTIEVPESSIIVGENGEFTVDEETMKSINSILDSEVDRSELNIDMSNVNLQSNLENNLVENINTPQVEDKTLVKDTNNFETENTENVVNIENIQTNSELTFNPEAFEMQNEESNLNQENELNQNNFENTVKESEEIVINSNGITEEELDNTFIGLTPDFNPEVNTDFNNTTELNNPEGQNYSNEYTKFNKNQMPINNTDFSNQNDMNYINNGENIQNMELMNPEVNNFVPYNNFNSRTVIFIGTSKNGISFTANSLGMVLASVGVNTALLDMTKNRNNYYISTSNDESLRVIATDSISKLRNNIANGVPVERNLTVYTALPNDSDEYKDAQNILPTLYQNHQLVIIDADYTTDFEYFKMADEIYLVQSLDVLTIQPLTTFLKDLKKQNIINDEKIKVIINQNIPVKGLNKQIIVEGLSTYNSPSMSVIEPLFDRNKVKVYSIDFDMNAYQKYMENIAYCKFEIAGYPRKTIEQLKIIAQEIYPNMNK